jgi:hypothetical protein
MEETHDVRCAAKKHAQIVEGHLEVRCQSRFCGKRPGVVVLHRFRLTDGELLSTQLFRDPVGIEVNTK